EKVMGTDDHAFPVVEEGRLVGVVCLHDIREIPRGNWDRTTVREIMTPSDRLVTVASSGGADEALDELQRLEVRQLPVTDNGHLVGLLRRRDIIRWLQLQQEEVRPVTKRA
ncbi:MAG TPA: CBS domain-containing protein, partial [Candidatus Binatia bacterium]|nr:CBS domain-containing protein [Candidatus Binatia bacterium]